MPKAVLNPLHDEDAISPRALVAKTKGGSKNNREELRLAETAWKDGDAGDGNGLGCSADAAADDRGLGGSGLDEWYASAMDPDGDEEQRAPPLHVLPLTATKTKGKSGKRQGLLAWRRNFLQGGGKSAPASVGRLAGESASSASSQRDVAKELHKLLSRAITQHAVTQDQLEEWVQESVRLAAAEATEGTTKSPVDSEHLATTASDGTVEYHELDAIVSPEISDWWLCRLLVWMFQPRSTLLPIWVLVLWFDVGLVMGSGNTDEEVKTLAQMGTYLIAAGPGRGWLPFIPPSGPRRRM